MNEEKKDQLGEFVSKLDTASGMLLIASMNDPVVRQAMEMITNVSFDLGVFINAQDE